MIERVTEKPEKLEGMMKTAEGKRLARVRMERLRLFPGWWDDEVAMRDCQLDNL